MNTDELTREIHMADEALVLVPGAGVQRIEPRAGSWTWSTIHMHSVLQRLERRLTTAGCCVERVMHTDESLKRLIALDVREVVSGMPGTVSGGTKANAKRRARKEAQDAAPAPDATVPAPAGDTAPVSGEGEPAPVSKAPRKRRAAPVDEVTSVGG